MAKGYDRSRSASSPGHAAPTAQELRDAIDSGLTGDKVAFPDPAASPLGTDDEAAGTSDSPPRVATAFRQEVRTHAASAVRIRPLSPNIQIYRPQLTSVLSIANRITGMLLSVGAVVLVVWLIAGASGPHAYAAVRGAVASWIGQIMLFGFTFAFFLHLCGGIRHLVWDTVHGFELRSIYLWGWVVVAASVVLTLVAWIASLIIGR